MDELVDGVDEGFGGGGDDVGIGGKAVEDVALIFYLDVNLTGVITTFVDGLDEELLDGHVVIADGFFDGFEGSVDGSVTGSRFIAFDAGEVEADACHGLNAETTDDL